MFAIVHLATSGTRTQSSLMVAQRNLVIFLRPVPYAPVVTCMQTHEGRRGMSKKGFTLIELLVVIAIIAILAAILFPVFARARMKAQQANCISNLKQIGIAFRMYQQDYDGYCHPHRNGAFWPEDRAWSSNDLYWGAFYDPYIKNRQIWRCPSMKEVDLYGGTAEQVANTTYGLNGYVTSNGGTWNNFDKPAETILCHDSWEQRMDDNGDMLCPASGQTLNLTQWRAYPTRVAEYWRHTDSCNVLWYDGHAKNLVKSDAYPRAWYTG